MQAFQTSLSLLFFSVCPRHGCSYFGMGRLWILLCLSGGSGKVIPYLLIFLFCSWRDFLSLSLLQWKWGIGNPLNFGVLARSFLIWLLLMTYSCLLKLVWNRW